MVQYQSELDHAFAALADPTRRSILRRLGEGGATITELAGPHGMSLTGLKKHVRILEGVGLVTTEKVGRARRCSLGPRRLDDAQRWIETYRDMLDARLDRLGELLEDTDPGQTANANALTTATAPATAGDRRGSAKGMPQ
jgi:DNA-binding transcriptional ArsR family regulator